jgi:LmbE family N-acetylglucosaminyl deacetylase
MTPFKFSVFMIFMALLLWGGGAQSKILVVAPHPDDDILIAAGVTSAATQRGEQVTVVFMTNGDNYGTAMGNWRQDEAVDAQVNSLGNNENNLIFLGYPDGGLETMYSDYPSQTDQYLSPNSGQNVTYGHRGLGGADYHYYKFGAHAQYNGFNLLKDLKDIIDTQRPDQIITVAEIDQHTDHSTTSDVVHDAIVAVTAADPTYVPVFNKSLVHSVNENIWPMPADPTSYFNEPPGLTGTGFNWDSRESLDVPMAMQVNNLSNLKTIAINSHASQGGSAEFIGTFVHKDEFFWPSNLNGSNFPPRVEAGLDQVVMQGNQVVLNGTGSTDSNDIALNYHWRQISGPAVTIVNANSATPSLTAPTGSPIDQTLVFELIVDDGALSSLPDHSSVLVRSPSTPLPNIAPLAAVNASGQNTDAGQFAEKAIDGVADGWPGDYSREWASPGQGVGAWIQLDWHQAYEVYRIVLHDRPNTNDHIRSAKLTFSNGSIVTVGELDNTGAGVEVNFPPVVTNALRMTVTTVSGSTQNVGLSEVEVYAAPAVTGNQAPVAHAGPDKTVGLGASVNLDGHASTDPDGSSLVSYSWLQTSGPNVTLQGANTVTPTFVAPSGLTTTLKFALVVNDGQLNSIADSVSINVTTSGSGTNLAPLATVKASSQNFNTHQVAANVVDGVADGFPGDFSKEWATSGGLAGSWLELNWSAPYKVNRVVLFDRPNGSDQILAATLKFSNGSTVAVGALDNAGSGVVVNLPSPVVTNSIRVTVTSVSGASMNVGLSELEVYGVPSTDNLAPVANAGLDQTASEGAGVYLDGRASISSGGNPLTYLWAQTTGPVVSLIDDGTPTPSFLAPTGLIDDTTILTFALIVNDGQLNSTADTVRVTVSTAVGSPTNIASLATVTASAENTYTSQLAAKAIDGVADGWPGDYSREWAAPAQGVNAWINLGWAANYQVSRVVLYDRPNPNDQITGATLTFSDGTVLTVDALANSGEGLVINFPAIVTNSLKVTITSVSGTTENVGLSELKVFGVAL